MSVNRKRNESCCTKCHNARPSRFGRWCEKCWQQLTHEERLAAAELAILEDDDDPRLAPPRLALPHERRNGNDYPEQKWLVANPRNYAEARALRADGWEFSHLTALGSRMYKRAR